MGEKISFTLEVDANLLERDGQGRLSEIVAKAVGNTFAALVEEGTRGKRLSAGVNLDPNQPVSAEEGAAMDEVVAKILAGEGASDEIDALMSAAKGTSGRVGFVTITRAP
ncbi:MAG: hypothetical protein GC136_09030 [Alphaproteobacteria bacterium]|nr:hypothetical protein [Alphaproteobacteria bacterium]